MSKIVVITGSPRKHGNTTTMAEAFIREAKLLGHEVVRFDAASMKVAPCMACDRCYTDGKPCVQDDDWNDIAPVIESADGIVFAAPTYWYTFPAQIKTVLDRMYSLAVGKRDIAGKKCALITACEEEDVAVMDGLIKPLERAAALMKWDVVGSVRIPGVYRPGEISGTSGVHQAEVLAAKF